jgi:hypothetical protein
MLAVIKFRFFVFTKTLNIKIYKNETNVTFILGLPLKMKIGNV